MSEERDFIPGQRLGRLPTSREQRQTNFKLARYLPTLPVAPMALDLKPLVSQWPMYANDRLGDCTCAAIGHMLEVWTAQVDGKPTLVTDEDVIALYNLVNGGQDNGADMGNVLDTVRHVGIAGEKVIGYAEVDVANKDQLRAGAWLFSGVYFGAELAIGNQGQAIWDAVEGPQGSPGSWGGHAINLISYSETGGELITWGGVKAFTWAWWDKYVDEAYVAIPEDYSRLLGKPLANGFDMDQLKKDLQQLPNPNLDMLRITDSLE
jgi:hypothetical protein